MPTICTFYGILIQMFWNDHAPPHFHALYTQRDSKFGNLAKPAAKISIRPKAGARGVPYL
ncbi:MAG: DUF4160 domain-containing protein [Verrucomicrobiota bacterium]|nr:DUF4160 domain-containing protein [Verrucomicrobiota bacterium]